MKVQGLKLSESPNDSGRRDKQTRASCLRGLRKESAPSYGRDPPQIAVDQLRSAAESLKFKNSRLKNRHRSTKSTKENAPE